MKEAGFESWALVELMGHQRIAGLVTEAEIGGCKFVRVDVPERGKAGGTILPALTKYLGPSSIYAITPVNEETARTLSLQCSPEPVNVWDAREFVKRIDAKSPAPDTRLIGEAYEVDEDEDEDSL